MVKRVLKTLILTPVIIGIVILTIELVYLSVSSQQVKYDIKLSLNSACESFNQETYKKHTNKYGATVDPVDFGDIYNNKGGTYLSGNVYGLKGIDEDARYDYLFGYGAAYDKYYQWLTNSDTVANLGVPMCNLYTDLGYLKAGLDYKKGSIGRATYGSNDYAYQTVGIGMVEDKFTPMNLGIPYIGTVDGGDRVYNAVNNIFRWNLTQMESRCNSTMIKTDDKSGIDNQYVKRDGWRIYARQASISSIEYYTFDVTTSSGRSQLYDMVSLGESQYVDSVGDNKYITIAKVGFRVPVGYEGITPLAKYYNYVMSKVNKGRALDNYKYMTTYLDSSDLNMYVYYYNVD